MKVRYLDVELNEALTSKNDVRPHLLIPIGVARIDDYHDDIWIDTLNAAGLFKCPLYRGGPITRDLENSIRKALKPDWDYNRDMQDNDYYNEAEYDDKKFYESGEDNRRKYID